MKKFFFAVLLLLGLFLGGCGVDKSWQNQARKNNSVKIQQNHQEQEKPLAKISEDKMYSQIEVKWKKLTIPAWWKSTWDYLIKNWKKDWCKYLKPLGDEFVQYCIQTIEEKEKQWFYKKQISQQTTWKDTQSTIPTDITNSANCSNIKNKKEKEQCYFTNRQCDKIENKKLKAECYVSKVLDKAVEKKDVKLCDKLKNKDLIQICKDRYHSFEAFNKKDIKICDKISDSKEKQRCKDWFYMNQAVEKKDSTLCNKIKDDKLKKECLKMTSNK